MTDQRTALEELALRPTPSQRRAPSGGWGVCLDFEDADCPPAAVVAELDAFGLAYVVKGEGYLATRCGLEVRDALEVGI